MELPPIPPPYRNIVIDPGDKNFAPTLRTVSPGNFISGDLETICGFGEFAWWMERRRIDKKVWLHSEKKEADQKWSDAAENARTWLTWFRLYGKTTVPPD